MNLFTQQWRNVLFLHWPVAPECLRVQIPAPLELDTFAGAAWISVVALEVGATRPFGFVPLGPIGRCLQVNLRTYVRHRGTGGVWFFSIDTDNSAMVVGARLGLGQPYHRARARRFRHGSESFEVLVKRKAGFADFWATWHRGEPMETMRGSIDRFVTERYHLFGHHSGGLYRQRIAHPPWSLHRAELLAHRVSISESAGLPHLEGAPLVHASPGVDTKTFAPQPLNATPEIAPGLAPLPSR